MVRSLRGFSFTLDPVSAMCPHTLLDTDSSATTEIGLGLKLGLGFRLGFNYIRFRVWECLGLIVESGQSVGDSAGLRSIYMSLCSC